MLLNNTMKKPKHVITQHNEWVKEQIQSGIVCAKCSRGEPLVKLTADHIVPLSLLAQFGIAPEFDPENLELLS